MKQKIRTHIQNCIKCILFLKPSGKVEDFVHSIPKGTFRDCARRPLRSSWARECCEKVLVLVDAFTKYVKFYAIKTMTTQETIRCLKDYCHIFSQPNFRLRLLALLRKNSRNFYPKWTLNKRCYYFFPNEWASGTL